MKRLGSIAAAATVLVAAAALALFAPGRPATALGAADAAPPEGAVSGVRSPAAGVLELRITASDTGAGLAAAEAMLDGGPSSFLRLGTGSCPEHPSPGSESPSGAGCPEAVSGVPLKLDTRAVADGERRLRVRVTDGAGNTATLVDEAVVVRNAPYATGTSASVAVGVSSGGGGGQPGRGDSSSPPANGKGKGGSPLALRRKRCRAPRLRMRLARRPLWHTRPHHVPVLRYRRRYPFKGRLTCLDSSHHRVPAPRGTRVGVFYRVWHLSFKRPWGPVRKLRRGAIRVRKGGRLKIRLAFTSGRTLIFRYRDPGGKLAKAKLRLAVPPRSRKPPWGPR
jgi:hypothetical protein